MTGSVRRTASHDHGQPSAATARRRQLRTYHECGASGLPTIIREELDGMDRQGAPTDPPDRRASRAHGGAPRILGDELEETIHDTLAGISALFGLDRAYVLMIDLSTPSLELFREWWAEGVPRVSIPIAELPEAAQAFWLTRLAAGDTVYLPSLDEAPPGGAEAVASLVEEGVQSILFLPLRSHDITVGFFGFEARRAPAEWSPAAIALMRTMGDLFVGAVERRRAERALSAAAEELAERNAELERSNRDLEDFASIASHDLKSPLPVVRGFVELLGKAARDAVAGEGTATVEDVDTYVGAVVRGVNRMRDLIDDLLSYARARRGPAERKPVDLDEVVRQLASEVMPADATVRIEPLPTVAGERAQLSHLFQNLLTNAAKFVAPDTAPDVEVTAQRLSDTWHVVVADRGIGVDADDRRRIFDMFTRVGRDDRVSGTGIGLAVCARVAESHGGRIWMEERPGGGSRFVVALPADAPPSEAAG
jgi:signal transduction histidine kinase